MKPITGDSPMREVFPAEVEVVTWVDFGSPEKLTLAARAVEVELGRNPAELPDAEPGKRYCAYLWPCGWDDFTGAPDPGWFIEREEAATGDDLAAMWTNAYLLGVLRASWVLAVAGEAGIGGRVFAVRVQEKGAVFPGSVQTGDGGPVL